MTNYLYNYRLKLDTYHAQNDTIEEFWERRIHYRLFIPILY